jgi:hypothetical protein
MATIQHSVLQGITANRGHTSYHVAVSPEIGFSSLLILLAKSFKPGGVG